MIVIIGLIGSVAMISMQSLLPGQALNTAVGNLSDTLYGARNEAISRSRKFEIHYQIDEDEYWVETPYRSDGTGLVQSDEELRLITSRTALGQKGIDIESVTIDEKEYFDGEVEVRFDPLGSTSHHTVVLKHGTQETVYTVEVLSLTGDIRFHEGYWKRLEVDEKDFD